MHNNRNIIRWLRYKFDNTMAAGSLALIGWLSLISLCVIFLASIILTSFSIFQDDKPVGFMESSWISLMHTLDSGNVAGDNGWPYRIIMLLVTIGGIFIVSILIGILTTGLEGVLENLRKGRSFVLEKDHTIILGWSPKIFSIISELIIANSDQKKPRIVILADKDKVEMEDEIRSQIKHRTNTKIICRSGNPIDINDLEIVNPNESKSIIVLAPVEDKPDIRVIKTVMAITNHPNRRQQPFHIVAELTEPKNIEACNLAGNNEVTLVLHGEIISRITAQTCRQSGLSLVYTELLDFAGAEIYFSEEKSLTGKTFKEIILFFSDSCVIGIKFKNGTVKVNPPMQTILAEGDSLIMIAEDNSKINTSAKPPLINSQEISKSTYEPAKTESTLILGWNRRGIKIISELDNYVAPGSRVNVVADIEEVEEQVNKLRVTLTNQSLEFIIGDTTDRETLESINIPSYNHIILLCYSDNLDIQEADAKTLICLLHLRNISQKKGQNFSIVSEMMDLKNKELAEITRADDFIISDKLISLILSQLSENKDLKLVFDELFNAEGSEIYLKPASQYIKVGNEVDFYTVTAAAGQRNEVAIGYRLKSLASDSKRSYGIFVNPPKAEKIKFNSEDRVIVLSENER